MENKKGSLSTVFLVIAIILIGVMGVFMYMQKTEADRQIAELENNASKMQETINDLQGKIDTISNTINSNKTPEVDNTQEKEDEVKYDVEVEMSEIENIKVDYTNHDTIVSSQRVFYDKYYGKTLKITGYVSSFGDEYDSSGFISTEFASGVNLGNSETYEKQVYATGITYDKEIAKEINNLEIGQKISIIGVLPNPDNSMSLPVELKILDIIK